MRGPALSLLVLAWRKRRRRWRQRDDHARATPEAAKAEQGCGAQRCQEEGAEVQSALRHGHEGGLRRLLAADEIQGHLPVHGERANPKDGDDLPATGDRHRRWWPSLIWAAGSRLQ